MAGRGAHCPVCQAPVTFEVTYERQSDLARPPQMKWNCDHDPSCTKPPFLPSVKFDVAAGTVTILRRNVEEWFQTLAKRGRPRKKVK
jgi:hypothetical protein